MPVLRSTSPATQICASHVQRAPTVSRTIASDKRSCVFERTLGGTSASSPRPLQTASVIDRYFRYPVRSDVTSTTLPIGGFTTPFTYTAPETILIPMRVSTSPSTMTLPTEILPPLPEKKRKSTPKLEQNRWPTSPRINMSSFCFKASTTSR